ncbi:MAG: HEAT repeat domain-containing protein [Myxococcota bacterium]
MRWLVGALMLAGCSQAGSKHYLERIEVERQAADEQGVATLDPAEVKAQLVGRFRAHGRFVVLEPKQKAPREVALARVSLSLDFVREVPREDNDGSDAEVGGTLVVRPRGESLARYEVSGRGTARVLGEGTKEQKKARRVALERALTQIVEATHLLLMATQKKDQELVKDLEANDARVRAVSLRVLTERKNPAAAAALREKLTSSDGEEVRAAIGGLVELRATEAVPEMIDLARNKDPMFLQEIIFALAAIGGDEAQAYLYTVAQGHDQPSVQAAAKQALEELSRSGK